MLQHNEFWKFVSQNDLHFSIGASVADMASSSLIPISLSYIVTHFLAGHLASQLTTVFVFFFPPVPLESRRDESDLWVRSAG